MNPTTITDFDQREVTRVCIHAAQLLMQHGTESALVESVSRRLGEAFGADSVEVALMANAITLTTLKHGHCVTTVRRNIDRGINMHMAVGVQRVMLDAEAGRIGLVEVARQLDALRPFHYNRWLVVFMIGLSCAGFARLVHADWIACGITFVASAVAMAVRQLLAQWHFNPIVNFTIGAFVATSISAQGLIYQLGATPKIAMASCVLLFVPGMPLINAVSDMVKGYMNTGIARMGMAVLLCIGTCIGILLAMLAWNVRGWL
ncbi:threonine/serine ThrE exporter family protein [Geminisphaera colitermitum]|uniref:threonine/serine ThrE exporter family protein n=1 Tax=Geminisphaera colitermitum TaxID=1148786 RepID=UPI000158CB2F|nr:threonine/serine exporter family protein [Geminisphaera colitermitum]